MSSMEASQLYSRENVDNGPRKPGVNIGPPRKAFGDRDVNAFSPTEDKNRKEALFEKVQSPQVTPAYTEDDDLFFYDTCSYIDLDDNFSDILCFNNLTRKDTLKILRSYAGYSGQTTPPPQFSPDVIEISFEFPEMKMSEDFNNQNLDNFNDYQILELSVDDIPLPELEIHFE